ncbi:hypothetical protein AALT_g11575 [Alternaria alternata]|jgi:hypothetical protein|nr:hypothetical protein AALT_g11575 [Alternaria alternata]
MSSHDLDLEEGMVPVEMQKQEPVEDNFAKSVRAAYKPTHTTFLPSGQTLVGQLANPLYSWDRWTATAYHDIHFVKEEWVLTTTIHNDTSNERHEERAVEMGTSVINGSENVKSVSANAGFSGWGFSMNVGASVEQKTFKSTETTVRETVSRIITVPANTSIYLYQKVYTFKLVIFFVWRDTKQFGGKELKYSRNSSWQGTVFLECQQTVNCDEWYYGNQKLETKTGTITLPAPSRREPPPSVCQWHNINGGAQQAMKAGYPGV